MCLYEQSIKNQKYEPNIKNRGNAPKANDYRQLFIKIGCGWCIECRKKISNEWKIRLWEEINENKNVEFVNLSFSPESITKIEKEIKTKNYKGIKGNEIDVNIAAAYAIRMFTERWRKKYKHAPKHWLVTELGHENSERLHLHGLIWNTEGITKQEIQKEIENKWMYGNVKFGKFVNEKTINYISKYITKLDDYHKGYKQKIFTSKKMGIGYIKKGTRINKYDEENTITYYRTSTGYEMALPKYYKEKIWNDEEREKLWSIQLDKNEVYIGQQKYDSSNEESDYVEKFNNALNKAREENLRCEYGDNRHRNQKYIITEKMKMNYKQLIDNNRTKFVKKVARREIDKIEDKTEDNKISKENGVRKIYYGKYIGTTTETERNYNELFEDAKILGISVKKLRLIKNGIVSFNSQVNANKQIENGELLITLLKNKYENS